MAPLAKVGGLADVVGSLAFPIAGLLSDRPFEEVAAGQRSLRQALAGMVAGAHDPFDTLQFMALTVIPELKLSDRGLVDVSAWGFTGLFA